MLMRTLRTKTRSIMLIIVIVFVLSTVGVYLMRGNGGGQSDRQGDYAVATIDGKKVMRSNIDIGVRNMAEQSRSMDLTQKTIVQMRKSVLENMAIYEELKKETVARGITVEESEVDEAVKRIEDQFPTKEAFQQYMENNKIRMKDLREEIGLRLAQQKLIDQVTQDATVSDEEAMEFYEQTKDFFFSQPAGYEVTYGRFASLEAAQNAKERIFAGESWDEVLESYSEEDLLEWTPLDDPVFLAEWELQTEELKDFAELETGEIGGPVEFGEGNVIILAKRSKVEARTFSFEDVSGDVVRILEREKVQQNESEFFDELLKRAEIKILDEEYFAIPESPVSGDEDAQSAGSGDQGQSEVGEKTAGENALTE